MPFNNGSSTSAGVYTGERNLSFSVEALASSIGGIVGPSKRGPVLKPTLTVDQNEWRSVFGLPDILYSYMHFCAEAFLTESTQLFGVRVAVNAKHGGVKVSTVDNFSQCTPVDSGLDSEEDILFNPSDIMYFYAENPGEWNNDLRIVIYPNTDDITNETFILEVYEGNSSVAVESYVATAKEKLNAAGDQLSIENQLLENSRRLRVLVNEQHYLIQRDQNPINALSTGVLTEGDDGDEVTDDDIAEAWELFYDPEEVPVNILINAGSTSTFVQLKIDEIAQNRDNCFGILDFPKNVQGTQELVNYRRNVLNLNSSHSALYAPYLVIRDEVNNTNVTIPPSGHVAAAFARTDREAQLWFAPAGINRGQLDVIGVKEVYKQGHRDALDANQINPIRLIPGQGFVIWGQETLAAEKSSLSNINVRRLISHLKISIANAVEIAIYEPHDSFLRSLITNVAERFLSNIQSGRGLYWYSVVCDESNNPPSVVASGDLIVDIYLDPVIATKRIHLNTVVVKTGEIKFAQELINAGS